MTAIGNGRAAVQVPRLVLAITLAALLGCGPSRDTRLLDWTYLA